MLIAALVDAAGNLLKASNAMAHSQSFRYHKVGNVMQMTDARAKVTHADYDAMKRRVQITNPVGGVHKLQYNGQGLPVAESDEDGHTRRAEFDTFLRLTRQTDPLGHITDYRYDIPDGSGSGALGALHEPTEIKYPPSRTAAATTPSNARPATRSCTRTEPARPR